MATSKLLTDSVPIEETGGKAICAVRSAVSPGLSVRRVGFSDAQLQEILNSVISTEVPESFVTVN